MLRWFNCTAAKARAPPGAVLAAEAGGWRVYKPRGAGGPAQRTTPPPSDNPRSRTHPTRFGLYVIFQSLLIIIKSVTKDFRDDVLEI